MLETAGHRQYQFFCSDFVSLCFKSHRDLSPPLKISPGAGSLYVTWTQGLKWRQISFYQGWLKESSHQEVVTVQEWATLCWQPGPLEFRQGRYWRWGSLQLQMPGLKIHNPELDSCQTSPQSVQMSWLFWRRWQEGTGGIVMASFQMKH